MLGEMKRFLDRQPLVFGACVLGIVGITLPFTVVPLRKAMGMHTVPHIPAMS
jgi:hypothetical protein